MQDEESVTSESELLVDELLGLVLESGDFDLSQSEAIRLANHPQASVRGIALLCFGHIARIHRKLNTDACSKFLIAGLQDVDSFVRGHAESAISDVAVFLGVDLNGEIRMKNDSDISEV